MLVVESKDDVSLAKVRSPPGVDGVVPRDSLADEEAEEPEEPELL